MRPFSISLVIVLAARAQDVNVWLTTHDQTALMQPQPRAAFGDGAGRNAMVIVSDSEAAQTIEGFGASMTDSAAFLLHQKVPAGGLAGVMQWLFGCKDGIGVSFLRNPMGASDLARSHYSYDDLPAGQTDPALARLSIEHDQADILPLLRMAKAINPELKMMGTPWSPPGWMKTSGAMVGGALVPSVYDAFAQYFVRYLKAYDAAGVPVDYVSIQNEPLLVPTDYPGMSMPAAEQVTLLRDYLLPAFAAAHVTTRVLAYDHNWDEPAYPEAVLADTAIALSPQVAGVAWHWYSGTAGAMTRLHNAHPAMGQFVTEASGGLWIADEVRSDFEAIVHSMRNWSTTFVKWGLALDQNRGPHTGGCTNCAALVTVDQNTGAVTRTVDYYTLGHFSKFVRPGSVRVWSSNAPGVITAAFVNPDRTRVLVAYNDSGAPRAFDVAWNGRYFETSLNAWAGATYTWSPPPAARPSRIRRTVPPSYAVSATQQIQASSYNAIAGAETETCTDEDGGFDAGYATDGAWAEFRNVDFGDGVRSLSARVASAAGGGTLEFHVGSASGSVIAQAAIPVTGGWQKWTTVTAPVEGARGVQTLYVVWRSSGSSQIGNLNWFRFEYSRETWQQRAGRATWLFVATGVTGRRAKRLLGKPVCLGDTMLCLVVDDDTAIRTFVCSIAHAEGMETLEAEGGDEAFHVLRMLDGAVDLLITDIHMPNGDGLTLARAAASEFPAVPIILMSGYAEPDAAFDFVPKPFSWAAMRDAVQRILARPAITR